MTRRNLLHKWSVYALGLLLVWVLDAYILPRYPVFGISPMLLPLAAAAVAVLEGAHAGAGFGMAVGLVWELAYPGGFGGLVFGMALAGLLLGAAAQYGLSQSFPGYLLCCGVLLAVLDLMRILRALLYRYCSRPPFPSVCSLWSGPLWCGCCFGWYSAGWAAPGWPDPFSRK